MSNDFPEQEIHLMIEGEWTPLSRCEFIDISEDPMGFDVYTVNYQGKEYQSKAVLRWAN